MLNQLDSDDSVLLLYLAGELPAEGKAEVDRRLSAEPALREELGRLAAVQGAVADWFQQADATLVADDEVRGRSSAAVRRVSRAFVQRRATEEAARAAAAKNESMWPKSLLPRWAYPLTAAAAIIVGLLSLVQWGGSLVGSDRGGHNPLAEMRGDEGPGGGGGGPFGGGYRVGSAMRAFAGATYGINEDEAQLLQHQSATAYDVSTMFQPEMD